jgi:hypothetical protein
MRSSRLLDRRVAHIELVYVVFAEGWRELNRECGL